MSRLESALASFILVVVIGTGAAIAQVAPGVKEGDDILLQMQSQPVELETYVFRRLLAQKKLSPKATAEALRTLRDRSRTARDWYPSLPLTAHLGLGYSGVVAAAKFGLDGLSIVLTTIQQSPGMPPGTIRQIISDLPKEPGIQPTCEQPLFSSRMPLYRYLAESGKTVYPGRDQQLGLFTELVTTVDSPFDLAALLDLLLHFDFANPNDLSTTLVLLAQRMERIDLPPCGASPLQSQFGLSVNMSQALAKARGSGVDAALLAQYRNLAARSLSRPVCEVKGQPDPDEIGGRRKLVEAVNMEIKPSASSSVSAISDDEIRSWESERKTGGKLPAYSLPASVDRKLEGLVPFIRDPAMAQQHSVDMGLAMNNFLEELSKLEASNDKFDFRSVDARYCMLELTCQSDGPVCKRGLPELVSYLTALYRLKAEYPAIWLAYAVRTVDLIYRLDETGSPIPPQPWAVAVLDGSSDQTLRLLAKVH